MTNLEMARSHLRQARSILAEVELHQRTETWHLVVRRCQEAVERALKAVLRSVGVALAWQREVWAFAAALAIAVKSLAFLAAGLAYCAPALVSRRRVAGGLGVALVLAGVQTAWLPVVRASAGSLRDLPITLTHAVAILIAGWAYWPAGARRDRSAGRAARAVVGFAGTEPLRSLLPHGRGARLLALSLLAWGALQVRVPAAGG